jgi:2-isopropylmalate synthase
MLEDSAMGDGMIDAAYGAIARAAGIDARLMSFNVSAITGGSDALGDVVVQVDVEGRPFTGRGVSADVVEASARAFLAAVNRSVRKRNGHQAGRGQAPPHGTPVGRGSPPAHDEAHEGVPG